jgi:hypothetical protein
MTAKIMTRESRTTRRSIRHGGRPAEARLGDLSPVHDPYLNGWNHPRMSGNSVLKS